MSVAVRRSTRTKKSVYPSLQDMEDKGQLSQINRDRDQDYTVPKEQSTSYQAFVNSRTPSIKAVLKDTMILRLDSDDSDVRGVEGAGAGVSLRVGTGAAAAETQLESAMPTTRKFSAMFPNWMLDRDQCKRVIVFIPTS